MEGSLDGVFPVTVQYVALGKVDLEYVVLVGLENAGGEYLTLSFDGPNATKLHEQVEQSLIDLEKTQQGGGKEYENN